MDVKLKEFSLYFYLPKGTGLGVGGFLFFGSDSHLPATSIAKKYPLLAQAELKYFLLRIEGCRARKEGEASSTLPKPTKLLFRV